MKKEFLTTTEQNTIATMYDRIKVAMHKKGFNSIAELNKAIKDKRGVCPDSNFYTKLQTNRDNLTFYNMKIENLYIIADALNVTTDYLLGYEVKRDEKEVDYSKFSVLGLSESSAHHLAELKSNSDNFDPQKIKTSSRYYLNPYAKVLESLNWIIAHTDIDDESNNSRHDFLTTIYHMVMQDFSDTKGVWLEALLNEIIWDSYDDWNNYKNFLNEKENDIVYLEEEGKFKKDQLERKLNDAREEFVKSISYNRRKRAIFEKLKKGIIPFSDPISYDEVEFTLSNPQDDLQKRLIDIIKNWKDEYQPILVRKKEKQEQDYANWAANENRTYINPLDDIDEDSSFENNFTSDQWDLFRLLKYFENSEFDLISIEDDGRLEIHPEDVSTEELEEFVANAKSESISMHLRKGQLFFQ